MACYFSGSRIFSIIDIVPVTGGIVIANSQNIVSFWGRPDEVSQAPYWGFAAGPHWGISVPRPPILDPQLAKPVYALTSTQDNIDKHLSVMCLQSNAWYACIKICQPVIKRCMSCYSDALFSSDVRSNIKSINAKIRHQNHTHRANLSRLASLVCLR